MECKNGIIPSKLESSLFRGDMNAYKEALYKIFRRDFIDNDIYFQGKKVDIIHEKFFEGKERSFWHIISEGDEDINRTPVSWRGEAITWAKPLIEDDGNCSEYRKWKKYHDKTKKDRYYVWCVAIKYMVILEDRDTYYKLITAYPVQEYRVKTYNKEYQKYSI